MVDLQIAGSIVYRHKGTESTIGIEHFPSFLRIGTVVVS